MCSRVLVIDGSAMVRRQVGRALSGGGFSVVGAADGVDALQKLAGSPDTRLIVCDVNMPRMNGIELQDREFIAAIREGRGPNSSVAQVFDCYRVLAMLEDRLDSTS